jgi:hypothetical protein
MLFRQQQPALVAVTCNFMRVSSELVKRRIWALLLLLLLLVLVVMVGQG